MSGEASPEKRPADKAPNACLYLQHPATRWVDAFPVGNEFTLQVSKTPGKATITFDQSKLKESNS